MDHTPYPTRRRMGLADYYATLPRAKMDGQGNPLIGEAFQLRRPQRLSAKSRVLAPMARGSTFPSNSLDLQMSPACGLSGS